MGWVFNASAALPPGKTQYKRLGGPQSRSGRMRKISPPTGIRSPDRQARSESLYRLSYPGPINGVQLEICNGPKTLAHLKYPDFSNSFPMFNFLKLMQRVSVM